MSYYHAVPSYSSHFGQATKMGGDMYIIVSTLSSLHPQCLSFISRKQIPEGLDHLHPM